jgi:hypothetical protein
MNDKVAFNSWRVRVNPKKGINTKGYIMGKNLQNKVDDR